MQAFISIFVMILIFDNFETCYLKYESDFNHVNLKG